MAAGLRIGTRNVHVATVIMIIDVFRRNIRGVVTFGFSIPWMTLLSGGGRYFRF